MSITSHKVKEIVKQFGKNEQDTGREEVQCAILTTRINYLTEYVKKYKKDFVASRNLLRFVAKRSTFLSYLKKKNNERYLKCISALKLRK